jgi:hypothetical protein
LPAPSKVQPAERGERHPIDDLGRIARRTRFLSPRMTTIGSIVFIGLILIYCWMIITAITSPPLKIRAI